MPENRRLQSRGDGRFMLEVADRKLEASAETGFGPRFDLPAVPYSPFKTPRSIVAIKLHASRWGTDKRNINPNRQSARSTSGNRSTFGESASSTKALQLCG